MLERGGGGVKKKRFLSIFSIQNINIKHFFFLKTPAHKIFSSMVMLWQFQ